MKARTYKYLALGLCGGVLLQAGGCVSLGVNLLGELVFSAFLRGIVQLLLGTGQPA